MVSANSAPHLGQQVQLALDALALGDVAQRHREQHGAADVELGDGGLGAELLAVLAQPEDGRPLHTHAPRRHVAGGERAQVLAMGLAKALGKSTSNGLPSISSCVQPKIRSAPSLNNTTRCSSSTEMMASLAMEMMPRKRASARCTSSSARLRAASLSRCSV